MDINEVIAWLNVKYKEQAGKTKKKRKIKLPNRKLRRTVGLK